MTSTRGLTLIEVLVALALLGLVSTMFAGSLLSSFANTRRTGSQIEASLILGHIGRMAAGGATKPLPYSRSQGTLVWNYGRLTTIFPELKSTDTKIRNPDLYKVTVSAPEAITIGEAQVIQYRLQVCWRQQSREQCIVGNTAGPLPSLADPSAFNPGVN